MLCIYNVQVLYFINLQQKAIFSKSWGGPEKDRFLGFLGFKKIFFWFFQKSFWGSSFISSFFSLLSSLFFSNSLVDLLPR